jgi:hypothetical protein
VGLIACTPAAGEHRRLRDNNPEGTASVFHRFEEATP